MFSYLYFFLFSIVFIYFTKMFVFNELLLKHMYSKLQTFQGLSASQDSILLQRDVRSRAWGESPGTSSPNASARRIKKGQQGMTPAEKCRLKYPFGIPKKTIWKQIATYHCQAPKLGGNPPAGAFNGWEPHQQEIH